MFWDVHTLFGDCGLPVCCGFVGAAAAAAAAGGGAAAAAGVLNIH
jgi:hypothetical protein